MEQIQPVSSRIPPGAPVISDDVLVDLRRTLEAVRAGEATSELLYPRVFRVNEGLVISADLPSLERWD